MSATVTRRDQEQFRDAVRDLLGIHFDDTRLEGVGVALRQRLKATRNDVDGYLRLLGGPGGPGGDVEVRALAELLTVCETYFFRNPEQFRALGAVAIPERVRGRGECRTLRVLSAGCSSGEEPYTVAMVLRDSFPELVETWSIAITGVDVNPARIEHARAGRYVAWSLREVPDGVRRRWFRTVGREHLLDERIRRAVKEAIGALPPEEDSDTDAQLLVALVVHAEPRVVLMTASRQVRQIATQHGLRFYVPKPFRSEELLDTL